MSGATATLHPGRPVTLDPAAGIRSRRKTVVEVLGFVFNRYDDRRIVNRQMCSELEEEYPGKVFRTRIRTNIQLSKAQDNLSRMANRSRHSTVGSLGLAVTWATTVHRFAMRSPSGRIADTGVSSHATRPDPDMPRPAASEMA